MMIKIDGVDRQLLLHLLAVHIKETEAVGQEPNLNCYQEAAAQSLFERLQPQGLPIGADTADFVELPENGQQFEWVGGSSVAPHSCWVVFPALPPGWCLEQETYNGPVPSHVREARWPRALTIDAAACNPFS